MKKKFRKLAKRRRIVVYVGMVAIALLGAIVFYNYQVLNQSSEDTVMIVLGEDGFEPEHVTIEAGTRVVFSTTRDEFYWPASNVHPTHEMYAAFDPRDAITPDDTWTFQFDEVGIYPYHDHIAPIYSGTITVVETTGTGAALETDDKCEGREDAYQCMELYMRRWVLEKGIDVALETFVQYYKQQDWFAKECHGYAHVLGQEAYQLWDRGDKFPLDPRMAMCGYGFYHGFIEVLMLKTGDYTQAAEFCDNSGKDTDQAQANVFDCYHGMGHGVADFSYVGRPEETQDMIDQGVELCQKSTDDETNQRSCIDGVYNAVGVALVSPEYDLGMDRNDPFAICQKQRTGLQSLCYGAMAWPLMEIHDDDVTEVLQEVAALPVSFAGPLIQTVMGYVASTQIYSNDELVQFCLTASILLQNDCIEGTVNGKMDFGTPGTEHLETVEYCKSNLLPDSLATFCMNHLVERTGSYFGPARQEHLCTLLEDDNDLCK